jgi:signal transduction histidine kinase
MEAKAIFDSLNLFKQCRKYDLKLWQCPQFLFLVLGLVVIGSSLAIYAIGTRAEQEPEVVVLIVLAVAGILMVVGFLITQSFERLAEASRLKSEFVAIVSHQLRAPLANLNWAIDFLLSGQLEPVSEKHASYFQTLKENARRLADLVSDLLTVSRLESGQLVLKKEIVNPVELVKEAVERIQLLARAVNLTISLATKGEPLPKIFVDPSQISQALDNLLDNAVRYSRSSGEVRVGVSRESQRVRFEIRDNGLGVAPEDQPHLFQKFFRGRQAFKSQTQGSGLGLYIAKSIVEKSGGQIGFISKADQGSIFWFTIPIKS